MPESPDSERLHQEALREELEAAQRRRDSYQALLKDLPEIFEGKFRERLRPLQQRNDQLRLEGLALREQLRRILPQASAPDPAGTALKTPPSEPPLQARPAAPPQEPTAEARQASPGPKTAPARRTSWLWAGAITLGLAASLPVWLRAVPDRIPSQGRPDTAALPGRGRPADPAGFLRLRSLESSWLEVQASDGTSLHYGLLEGERRFPLGQGLRIRAGRPDLIRISLPGGADRVLGEVDDLTWHTIPAPRPGR